jgi:hypothetical protein
MRKSVQAIVAVIVIVGVAVAARPLAARAPQHVRIRVTSLDSTRSSKFHAAILVDGSPLKTFSGETPYETTASGSLALGVFEREGDGANFLVEIVVDESAPRARGPGPRIIVGSSVETHGTVFAHPY